MKGRKRYIWLFIGLGVFVLVAGTVAGLTLGGQLPQQQQQITVEQAMESVRRFEGSALADLKVKSMPEGDIHHIWLATASRTYMVDSYSGHVDLAMYFENYEGNNKVLLSFEEAEVKAAEFAGAHYASFTKCTLIERKLLDHGSAGLEYQFIWVEIVDGALTPNGVVVKVNPATGKVITYNAHYKAIQPFPQPSITAERAKAIVQDSFRADSGRQLLVSKPVLRIILVNGGQLLTWEVKVSETVGSGEMARRPQVFFIDAYSGTIVRP